MSNLLAPENYWIQDSVDSYLEWVAGYKENGMPRFDQCSILAGRVRVLIYDNPILAMKLGGTACVISGTPDIYMYSEFAKECIEADLRNVDTDSPTTDVAFILLHELSHKVLEHIDSLTRWKEEFGVSMENANKGMDTIINMGLVLHPDINTTLSIDSIYDYEQQKVVQGGYGLTFDEQYIFGSGRASALEVSRHYQMVEEAEKAEAEQKIEDDKGEPDEAAENNGSQSDSNSKQGEGNQNDKGSGGSQPEGQENGEGNGNDAKNDTGEQKPGGEFGLEHVSTIKDLVDALNEVGLSELVKRLGYPQDKIGQEKSENNESANVQADMNSYEQIKRQVGGAGSHIDSFISETFKAKENISIHSDLDAVLTDSLGLGKDDMMFYEDEPSEQFMHDPTLYGSQERVWEGTHIPVSPTDVLMVIIDTSGSMNEERLGFCLAAIKGSLSNIPGVEDVLLVEADTSVRNIQLTHKDDIENTEEFNLNGLGGTDIAPVMIEALINAQQHTEGEVKAVLYLTDMECIIPGLEEMQKLFTDGGVRDIPPTAFLVPPKCGNQRLFDQVADWASVTEIAHNNTMSFRPSNDNNLAMKL